MIRLFILDKLFPNFFGYVIGGQTLRQARKKQCPGNLSFDLSSQHKCLANGCQAWKWRWKSRNWRVVFLEPRGDCFSINIKDQPPRKRIWGK